MIPLRDDVPTLSFPFVTLLLIAANVGAFAFELSRGSELSFWIGALGAIPKEVTARVELTPSLALLPEATIVTSMFLHGGIWHLLGNMVFLWIFGNNVEDMTGHFRFVFFYLLAGCAAAYAHILTNPSSTVPMVGASGAVSGVLGAYLLLFPRARVLTLIFFGFFIQTVRIPAAFFLGMWFLMQFLSGAASLGRSGGGVAWFAHVGGFLAGMALLPLFQNRSARRRLARLKGGGAEVVLKIFDVAVLGDHLGGLAAAALSAKRGRRVLLFECTEAPVEDRPLELLNSIAGGPEREPRLGRFFHELGLSPFGPLGDDRINFRPLHPPLQLIFGPHRVNLYQDRVAREWEMSREFGQVQEYLERIRSRESTFLEHLRRFRGRPLEDGASWARRALSGADKRVRFQPLRREAEREDFGSFLDSLGLPPPLKEAMGGQVQGVLRLPPSALPWAVALRAAQVLQGALPERLGAERDPPGAARRGPPLRRRGASPGVPRGHRSPGSGVHLPSPERRRHGAGRSGGLRPAPREGPRLLPSRDGATAPERGLSRPARSWEYGIARFSLRGDFVPECMGRNLLLGAHREERPEDSPGSVLLAVQPGEGEEAGRGPVAMEALGVFREGTGRERAEAVTRERLRSLMPFFQAGLAGDLHFESGPLRLYPPEGKGWQEQEEYYRSGHRGQAFRHRQLLFLRNEDYIGAGLAQGLLSGAKAAVRRG